MGGLRIWIALGAVAGIIAGAAFILDRAYDNGYAAGQADARAVCVAEAEEAQDEIDVFHRRQMQAANELAAERRLATDMVRRLQDEARDSDDPGCLFDADSLQRLNEAAGFTD